MNMKNLLPLIFCCFCFIWIVGIYAETQNPGRLGGKPIRPVQYSIFTTDFGLGEEEINFNNLYLLKKYFHFRCFGNKLRSVVTEVHQRGEQHDYAVGESIDYSNFPNSNIFFHYNHQNNRMYFEWADPMGRIPLLNIPLLSWVDEEDRDQFYVEGLYIVNFTRGHFDDTSYLLVYYTFVVENGSQQQYGCIVFTNYRTGLHSGGFKADCIKRPIIAPSPYVFYDFNNDNWLDYLCIEKEGKRPLVSFYLGSKKEGFIKAPQQILLESMPHGMYQIAPGQAKSRSLFK